MGPGHVSTTSATRQRHVEATRAPRRRHVGAAVRGLPAIAGGDSGHAGTRGWARWVGLNETNPEVVAPLKHGHRNNGGEHFRGGRSSATATGPFSAREREREAWGGSPRREERDGVDGEGRGCRDGGESAAESDGQRGRRRRRSPRLGRPGSIPCTWRKRRRRRIERRSQNGEARLQTSAATDHGDG